jgi:hypothetical protein
LTVSGATSAIIIIIIDAHDQRIYQQTLLHESLLLIVLRVDGERVCLVRKIVLSPLSPAFVCFALFASACLMPLTCSTY